jgi:sugar/nucleoside kinase (ribokinase family)
MDAIPTRRFDPLSAVRSPTADGFDLLLTGTVFQDIIFTGLPHAPQPGTEIWSDGMGSCPGGVANQAIAAARLGLRTGLAAVFGDDGYGDYNWKILAAQEHVDLSLSRRVPGWHSPVTVSLSVDKDRSMVTHGHPAPVTSTELMRCRPPALAAVAELGEELEPWAFDAHKNGVRLFGDVGWDPTGVWSSARLDNLQHFHAFMPNQHEAMAFTGKDRSLVRVVLACR